MSGVAAPDRPTAGPSPAAGRPAGPPPTKPSPAGSSAWAPGAARRWTLAVVVAMVVFAVVASWLAVGRHRDFRTYRNDLGNMVQVVDNTAHGRILTMTANDGRQISRLGAHVDPVLALFAIPWLVWPAPEMLLTLQAVFLALAAWPAYRLGLRALGDPAAAAGCALAALLYPPLQLVALDEFHPVALAIPLLLFAFAALETDRRLLAIPLLVLAALCKEEIPLVIALIGIYFAVRKRRLWPLLITAAGVAYFAVAVGVIVPHFNDAPSKFLERYSGGEPSLRALALDLARHPWRLVSTLLGPSGLAYLMKLLWPYGFTSLASPLTFLICLPELFVNLLSSKPQQQSIAYHYVAGEVPFVIAAMVLGVRRLTAALASPIRLRRLLVALVVGVALVATLTAGPLSGSRRGWGPILTPAHRAVITAALTEIPASASVSADNTLGAHLSARPFIYTFPVIKDAQYVIVDSQGFGEWRARKLEALQQDERYRTIFDRDGVLVFARE